MSEDSDTERNGEKDDDDADPLAWGTPADDSIEAEDSTPDWEGTRSEHSADDPFDDLSEAVGDRSGDPFTHFDTERSSDEATSSEDDDSAGGRDERLAEGRERGQHGRPDPVGGEDDPLDGTPSSDGESDRRPPDADGEFTVDSSSDAGESLRDPSVGVGDDHIGDPFESPDSVFQQMDTDALDVERVWEELSEARERGSAAGGKRTYAEVSKHSYCEQCEHFSEPPAVRCTHEDTEILAFPDMEHVRVVDCPIVAERRKLEEGK